MGEGNGVSESEESEVEERRKIDRRRTGSMFCLLKVARIQGGGGSGFDCKRIVCLVESAETIAAGDQRGFDVGEQPVSSVAKQANLWF